MDFKSLFLWIAKTRKPSVKEIPCKHSGERVGGDGSGG